MIILESIRWKNFLSTGNNTTEVKLNEYKTTLISGINGSGKSTIMDAITFALFNKPFRRINKPQLINYINDRDCVVELEFTSGSTRYKVRRGIKPAIFEIYRNDKLLNQNADNRDYQEILEKRVLGMNYKTFCQIVILGSANWTPFMALRGHDRRRVIEDLLDIEVFSVMNTLLKSKVTDSKNRLNDINTRIAILENTIELNKKHREELQRNRQAEIESKKASIEEQGEIAQKAFDLETQLVKEYAAIQKELEKVGEINRQIGDAKSKKAKAARISKKLDADIAFYEENDTCPTCTQEIDNDFKTRVVSEKTSKKDLAREAITRVDELVGRLEGNLKNFETLQEQANENINQRNKASTQFSVAKKLIAQAEREIAALEKHVEQIETTEGNEEEKLDALNQSKSDVLNEREVYGIAGMLLKDNGIKTQIIRQYIPIMNQLINTYLERMEFFCTFELDENFVEQIKTRHKDVLSYDSFSQGEKMRIDLALLFTWREISKMRNSSPVSLLLLDEIMDSSLDASGTEEFLFLITQLTGDQNVVIISHKADQIADKFDKVLTVEKTKNFSHFKEV